MEIDLCILLIRTYLEDQKVNRFRAARLAGLSTNALQNMLNSNWDPRASTLRAMLGIVPNKYRCDFFAGQILASGTVIRVGEQEDDESPAATA